MSNALEARKQWAHRYLTLINDESGRGTAAWVTAVFRLEEEFIRTFGPKANRYRRVSVSDATDYIAKPGVVFVPTMMSYFVPERAFKENK